MKKLQNHRIFIVSETFHIPMSPACYAEYKNHQVILNKLYNNPPPRRPCWPFLSTFCWWWCPSPSSWTPPHKPGQPPPTHLAQDTSLTTPETTWRSCPPESPEAICQMLLQSSEPISPEDLPWFCVCTHCRTNEGPKGDRGHRGSSR